MRIGGERLRLSAWVGVIVAVGVVGYLLGHHTRASTVTVIGPGFVIAGGGDGTAYFLGTNQPLRQATAGFAYAMPAHVAWTDAAGTLHDGSRPACVPPYRDVRVRNMEAVRFTIPSGVGTGTVLWVQC